MANALLDFKYLRLSNRSLREAIQGSIATLTFFPVEHERARVSNYQRQISQNHFDRVFFTSLRLSSIKRFTTPI
jgi:hypothetical protein